MSSEKTTTDAASQHSWPVYIQEGDAGASSEIESVRHSGTAPVYDSAVGNTPFYLYCMLHRHYANSILVQSSPTHMGQAALLHWLVSAWSRALTLWGRCQAEAEAGGGVPAWHSLAHTGVPYPRGLTN